MIDVLGIPFFVFWTTKAYIELAVFDDGQREKSQLMDGMPSFDNYTRARGRFLSLGYPLLG